MKASSKKGAASAAEVSLDEALGNDQTLTIADKTVTVRAFRLLEGMRATPIARPIIAALREISEKEGENIPIDEVVHLLGRFPDNWVSLAALAADVSPEWITSLSYEDGLSLLVTFWTVNQGFFLTQFLMGLSIENDRGPSTSSTSSTDLSPRDTGEIRGK